ncbi:MAG: PAS domain S-box protein [Desulfosarcina sp.]
MAPHSTHASDDFKSRRRLIAELSSMRTRLAEQAGELSRLKSERARHVDTNRLELALEAAQLGTWDYNVQTGQVVWDERSRAIFGVASDEAIDMARVLSLIHPKDRLRFEKAAVDALDPARQAATIKIEYRILRPDGQERWVSAIGSTHFEWFGSADRPVHVIGTHMDITERIQEQRMLAAQLRLIEHAAEPGVKQLLRRFLDEAETLTGSQIGFFHFVDDDQATLSSQAWSTHTQRSCTADAAQAHYPISKAGVWVDCIRQRRPVVHNDYNLLPHQQGLPAGHIPVIRELVVPVMREDKVLAVLGVGNKQGRYVDADVRMVQRLADLGWETIVRLQIEEALRDSENRYRSLFHDNHQVILLIAPSTGSIVDANQAACDYYGYSKNEITNLTITDINILSDDRIRDEMQMAQAAQRHHFFFQHRLADGRLRDVEVFSGPLSIGGRKLLYSIVHDITDRKAAEVALAASETKYRQLMETANSVIIRWDCRGVIRFINDFGLRFFGYASDELIGRDVMTIVPKVERSTGRDLDAAIKDVVVHPERYTYAVNENITKDGRTVWVAWTNKAVLDEGGAVRQILAIGNDVTALKQAEAEKEVLLKEIHHRVKNNMQIISSLVSLQAAEPQNADMRESLLEVTHRVRSMAMVHEKLYQSADLACIDFADYAKSLLGYLWRAHGTAAAGIRLRLDLESVSLPVNAAVPFGLILNELVGNALKHAFAGRNGGGVVVSLRKEPSGRMILGVRDDGVGLPAGFDWQKAPTLGLRLVQMLARQIRATVKAAQDNGTEFIIACPRPDG